MARRRRSWALLAMVGLMLGACSGGDGSEVTAAGGAGGAGGASDPGGASGSPAGGTGETGGAAGSSGSGGAGAMDNADAGHDANSEAGHGDPSTDAAPTSDAGEAGRCLVGTLSVVNVGSAGYRFDGGDLNAPLTLCRENTYTFAINAPGHPFYIRSESGLAFDSGVTGNFTSTGDLVFVVPSDAPSTLFYQCDVHELMTGPIFIVN